MHYIYDFDDSCENFYIQNLDSTHPSVSMRSAHYHNAYEFYLYLGDGMTYYIDNQVYEVKQYDLVFVNAHTFHQTMYKTDHVQRILVMFNDSIFDIFHDKSAIMYTLDGFARVPVMSFERDVQQKIHAALDDMLLFSQGNASHPIGIAMAHFILSLQSYIQANKLRNHTAPIMRNEIKKADIIDYILKHYNTDMSLQTIAGKFFISKYHLCRRFKEWTGQSITDFINETRLMRARELLISSDLSILDISLSVGFGSPNYFNLLFKKKFGTTPFQYKKQMRAIPAPLAATRANDG